MNADDAKLLRGIRREQAIREGNLAAYRMRSRSVSGKKGKGVPYKRKEKYAA